MMAAGCCRIEGNLALGAQAQSPIPGWAVYEALANYQLCSTQEQTSAAVTSAVACSNGTVVGNVAAGSAHFGFIAQVWSSMCS